MGKSRSKDRGEGTRRKRMKKVVVGKKTSREKNEKSVGKIRERVKEGVEKELIKKIVRQEENDGGEEKRKSNPKL